MLELVLLADHPAAVLGPLPPDGHAARRDVADPRLAVEGERLLLRVAEGAQLRLRQPEHAVLHLRRPALRRADGDLLQQADGIRHALGGQEAVVVALALGQLHLAYYIIRELGRLLEEGHGGGARPRGSGDLFLTMSS